MQKKRTRLLFWPGDRGAKDLFLSAAEPVRLHYGRGVGCLEEVGLAVADGVAVELYVRICCMFTSAATQKPRQRIDRGKAARQSGG
jgi:hypothetical protein